jgi:hypothetical protein
MAQYSGPNTNAAADFTAARWGQLFGGRSRSCVLADAYSTALDVTIPTVTGQPGRMRLSPGAAWVDGHLYATDADVDVDVPLNGNTDARIVTLVLRKTRASGLTVPGYVAGTPASPPTPPSLADTAVTLEMPIRDVSQPGSNGSLTTARLRDDRRVFRHYPLQSARMPVTAQATVGPNSTDLWRSKVSDGAPKITFTPPPRCQVRFDWKAHVRHDSGNTARVGLDLSGGTVRPPDPGESANGQGSLWTTVSSFLVLSNPPPSSTTAEVQCWNSSGPGTAYFEQLSLIITIIPRDT